MGKHTGLNRRMSSTPIILVLSHGWAWQAQWLAPLLDAFIRQQPSQGSTISVYLLEQNYFSDHPTEFLHYQNDTMNPTTFKHMSDVKKEHPEATFVGLGHSLGLSQLLKMTIEWDGLISLHGFTQFVADINNPKGTPLRTLKSMIKKFEVSPRTVVHDFWRRCQMPIQTNFSRLNEKLLTDLEELTVLNVGEQLNHHIAKQKPLITVASECDAVVHPELTHSEQSLSYTVQTPHAGPCTHPKLYTEVLQKMLNTLSHSG